MTPFKTLPLTQVGVLLGALFILSPAAHAQSAKGSAKKADAGKSSADEEDSPAGSNWDPIQGRQAILQLSSQNWRLREKATEYLLEAGDKAHDLLREASFSADPEVRLRVHFILRRPEILTERCFDDMLADPSKERALKAFKKLTSSPRMFKPHVVRKIHEFARKKTNTKQLQRLATALDVYADMIGPEDTDEALAILRLDLSGAHDIASPFGIFMEGLARLPRKKVLAGASKLLKESRRSKNANLGPQACRVLSELGGPEQLPELLAALTQHKDEATKQSVARGVQCFDIDAQTVAKLAPLLKSEDEDTVVQTLGIMAEFRVKSLVPKIMKLLEHENETIVINAIRTLGWIGDARAAEDLRFRLWPKVIGATAEDKKQRLTDEAPTRGAAAIALARMDKCSTAELIAILGADQGMELAACLALGLKGEKEAVDHLKLLATAAHIGNNREAMQKVIVKKRFAIRALGLVTKDPSASQVLADIARKNSSESWLAYLGIKALRDQNTAVSRRKLLELLDTKRPNLVRYVADFLGDLDVREAVPQLIRALKAPGMTRSTRSVIATALGTLGGEDALRALRSQLKVLRGDAKRDMAWALARGGDKSYMPPIIKASKLLLEKGDRSRTLNSLGIDYLYAHDWQGGAMAFRRMTWSAPDAKYAAYNLACIAGLRKRIDDSLRLLRRSLMEDPDYWTGNWRHVATDPDLDSLHEDPRFKRIVERLKWKDYLNPNS